MGVEAAVISAEAAGELALDTGDSGACADGNSTLRVVGGAALSAAADGGGGATSMWALAPTTPTSTEACGRACESGGRGGAGFV